MTSEERMALLVARRQRTVDLWHHRATKIILYLDDCQKKSKPVAPWRIRSILVGGWDEDGR